MKEPANDGAPNVANQVLLLKSILLFFWAAWFTVVLASNLTDAGNEFGLLQPSWSFASGNLKAIRETTARYDTPEILNRALFVGVIVWELLVVILFWRAAWRCRSGSSRSAVYQAFTMSLSLWCGFVIADEICIVYGLEASHVRLFGAQLLTLLAIELLPAGNMGLSRT